MYVVGVVYGDKKAPVNAGALVFEEEMSYFINSILSSINLESASPLSMF